MQVHQAAWLNTAIPIVIVGIVLALRLRAVGRERRLRLETLWIVPALYLAATAAVFWTTPPGIAGWTVALIALAAGTALGWQRGRMMAISVDPETHRLSQRSSPAALLFLVALVLIRSMLRGAVAYEGARRHLDMAAVTEGLMMFGLGMFGAMRVEMFLRARRLLTDARAARLA